MLRSIVRSVAEGSISQNTHYYHLYVNYVWCYCETHLAASIRLHKRTQLLSDSKLFPLCKNLNFFFIGTFFIYYSFPLLVIPLNRQTLVQYVLRMFCSHKEVYNSTVFFYVEDDT
jgi:hypothetical protein